MDQFSYLSNAGIGYVEELYHLYRQDPSQIDSQWQDFFRGFDFAQQHGNGSSISSGSIGQALDAGRLNKEISVLNLIYAYRSRGHLFAQLNPILPGKAHTPTLDLSHFGLTEADLDSSFQAGSQIGLGSATLRSIVQLLQDTYCRSIGAEYKFIRNPERTSWLEQRMETSRNITAFSLEEKKTILRKIGQANTLEVFMHRKFVGQKRFSLEGAEAIIPALDATIVEGSNLDIREFVVGMAHRGRLNVLTNILQKEYDNIFQEFSGEGLSDSVFEGDVKYHLGYSTDTTLSNGKTVHLSLVPNPSHLEAVNPVVTGVARAKMDHLYQSDPRAICPILIHGDASLAGQGVIYEMIQMAELKGYQTGGTIHIVINNQVGFTTNPSDARSSTYCTDIAKVTLSPVFHVNGDDIEAVTHVCKLAILYRQTFQSDVFVDIICYRKYGHNEGDEPRYSQPLMYESIAKHDNPFLVYQKQLLQEGAINQEYIDGLKKELDDNLNKELEESKVNVYKLGEQPKRMWSGLTYSNDIHVEPNPETKVDAATLLRLAERISHIPAGFNAHKNISKLMAERLTMVQEGQKIDWAMAETLAYATLLTENNPVRITGQDVERGTFSHRHAVIKDMSTEESYTPLNNLQDQQQQLYIYNSHLSEFAVVGFEFGYSTAMPLGLTIWEAQYGDFNNGAQIIIDQFIAASKTKWQRMSGLVMLLPHGYEGGGPEHSSARLERFLQLCASNNMYVCNITTPANFFHAMRRQVKSTTRRPMIVMSPKSLLRHNLCVSTLDEFTSAQFMELIDDAKISAKKVKRVLLCSGKVYYDLLAERDQKGIDDIAIVRLEQIYPLPIDQLEELAKKYNKAKHFIWVQEEPENMGAWSFIQRKLAFLKIEGITRKESASPAAASMAQHVSQQDDIVRKALNLIPQHAMALSS
jgi:2-oxoglutarate dehydrogenase E1 component